MTLTIRAGICLLLAASLFSPNATSAQVIPPARGGTGTTTLPTYGKLLLGNSLGGYDLVATSSLGISSGGVSFTPAYPLELTGSLLSLAFGTTTLNTWVHQVFASLFATNASTTNATTTSFGINGETFTDLTGSGLTNASGALTLDPTGAWTGTFDGLEGTAYLANSFSTTSANHWQTTHDFFSTTSAEWFIHSSTTIPKTYSTNVFTGNNSFTIAPTLGSLSGLVAGNSGTLYQVATSTLTPGSGLSGSLVQVGTGGSVLCATADSSTFGCLTAANWSLFNNKISSSSLSAAYPLAYNSSTGAFTYSGLATTSAWTQGQVAYVAGNNTVTSIATSSFPSISGPFNVPSTLGKLIGGSGSITYWGLATTSAVSQSQVLYATSASGVASVGTTTLSFSGPFIGTVSGATIGGGNSTITYTGLATTSQPSSSNLLVSNGTSGVYGAATTSVTCSGNTSCTSFTAIGGAPITISSTGGGSGLSTTSPVSSSNLLVYSAAGAGAAYGIATSSATCSGGTSCSAFTVVGSVAPVITSFTYPFPSAATSTLLTLTGGILVNNATSTITNLVSVNATSTNATTTNLSVSGQLDVELLTSALVLAGSTGILGEYGGTTCTNQVTEDLTAVGGSNCVSINNDYWSGTDLSVANGGTGLSSFTANSLLYSNSAGTALAFAATSSLNIGGTAANVTGTVAVANGGTGTTTVQASRLLYGGGSGVYQSVATSSFAVASFPANYSGTFGAFVGGTGGTWTYWGLSTTSQPSSSNVLVSNGVAGVYGAGTTTASCSGTVSCTAFNILGTSPITITGSGGAGGGGVGFASTTASDESIYFYGLGYVGIGTSSPRYLTHVATGTAPQLALSDGSLTSDHWTLRTINSNFYIASSSAATFATSTNPQLMITSAGRLLIGSDGSLALPAFSFFNDSDTGFYSSGANQIGVAVGGAQKLNIGTGITVSNSTDISNNNNRAAFIEGAAGSVSAPTYSYVSDQNTGIYSSAAETLNFVTNGVERGMFTPEGLFGIGTSTPKWALTVASSTGPQLTLTDASLTANPWNLRSINSNFYLSTSSPSTFATSTMAALFIDTNGNIGIASTTPTKRFSVQGETWTSATSTVGGLNVLTPTVGTSTIYNYSKTAGFGGRIINEDTDGAGCTEIYTLNGTVSGVVITCPTEL